MAVSRFKHTATLLPSGLVMVIGSTGFASKTELYNPSTGTWSNSGSMTAGRYGFTSHLVNTSATSPKVLAIGGVNNTGTTNTTELYNPSTGTWSSAASMKQKRSHHASVVLNDGTILVVGGEYLGGTTATSSAELYNPITNTWTTKRQLLTARWTHTATLLNDGRVLVTGGLNSTPAALSSTEIYDPSTNIWTIGPTMIYAHSEHTATLLPDGRVLIVGGSGTAALKAEIFNPSNNTLSNAADLSYGHSNHTASLITLSNGSHGVLIVGSIFGTNTNRARVELYDYLNNTWNTETSMNMGRYQHTATLLGDGRILVTGGNIDAPNGRTAEYYTFSSTPAAPEAFLELPWDYGATGKSFDEMALNPNSWFDHAYPLQDVPCCTMTVLPYSGTEISDYYRSHSGYDYGSVHGIKLGTDVLAAASGSATFLPASQSGGAGNMLKIDHGNGYQTWYEHLSNDDLIISSASGSIDVEKGDMIGKVGMTGNTTKPHIHLSVFNDSNDNDTFSDDYPYGLVDPLGWEGTTTDPWEEWTNGVTDQTGARSYNLFLARKPQTSSTIPDAGGTFTDGNLTINVPSGAANSLLKIIIKNGPFSKISQSIKSIAPSFFLTAFNNLNQEVTLFLEPIHIVYDYSTTDLSNINEDSLKIHFLNAETGFWEEVQSTVDKTNKIIVGDTDHFSQFAVAGELKDLIAPVTNVIIHGEKGQDNWYRSDVSVELFGEDNEGGIGTRETIYTLNGSDWLAYSAPITFANEGKHTITYMSYDKADNKEEIKTVEFNIDKTPPEAKLVYDLSKFDIIVSGGDSSSSATFQQTSRVRYLYTVSDSAGNTLKASTEKVKKGRQVALNIKTLQYNTGPVINLDKIIFAANATLDKNNQIKQVDEYLSIAADKKVLISYSSKTNKTIILKRSGNTYIKEEKVGITLINLSTLAGALTYYY